MIKLIKGVAVATSYSLGSIVGTVSLIEEVLPEFDNTKSLGLVCKESYSKGYNAPRVWISDLISEEPTKEAKGVNIS